MMSKYLGGLFPFQNRSRRPVLWDDLIRIRQAIPRVPVAIRHFNV